MLEKTFGLLFFLKQPKNKEEDTRFIYVKITVDGKAVELSTKRRCEQSRWNSQSGRATGTKEAAKKLNQYLDSFDQYVFHVKRTLNYSDLSISAQSVSKMLGHASIKQTQHYAKTQDYKVGKDMLQLEKTITKRSRVKV